MKKLIAVAVASVLGLGLLSACGPQSGGGNNNPNLEGVTYNERSHEMYKDTKEGKTRIKFSYTPGFGDDWILQIGRDFLLDEIGANYYLVLDNDSELTTSVISKLEAGTGLSDIYFPLASGWESYASLGQLENLDDLYAMTVPGETKTVGEKIRGTWKEYGKAVRQNETHYYVFPGNENITGIVYNKTMFDQYGWEVPETTDDLKALCQKIVDDTKGKIAPFVYPGTLGGGYWDFIGTNWWLQVTGVEGMNEFMKFESPEVFNARKSDSPSAGKLEMLKTFEDIIVKNRTTFTLKGSASKNHTQSQISFMQGQAAMIPNGNWIENESLAEMEDEYRMMAAPRMKNALKDENGNYLTYNYPGQPDYLMIPAQAPNKEGAKLFLAYMCKDEVLQKYTTLTGTPRPFEYDVTKCEVTDFIKSCFDIWKDATTWFESSDSKLWNGSFVHKFNTSNPYSTLLSTDTATAISWCQAEYASVQRSWPQWQASIGE